MKKKNFTAAIMAAMIMCTSAAASAAETGYHRETGYAFVSGQTERGNGLITLEVLKPGHQWEELESASPLQALEMLAYFNQIKADAAGNFSVSWKMNGSSGEYPVRIYSEVEKEKTELPPFFFVSQSDVEDVLQSAYRSKTADELMQLLEDNIALLDVDLSVYQALQTAAEKKDFRTSLFVLKNKLPESAFVTTEALKTALEEAELMAKLNYASADELALFVETLDFGAQESYNIYTDSVIYNKAKKQDLLSFLAEGASLATLDDFRTRFGEAVVVYGCWQNDGWGTVQRVIAQSDLLKGYDLGNYHSLKDPSAVCKAVNTTKAPYASLSALAAAIKSAAAETGKTGGAGGNAGGGGSGSGKGGGTGGGSQYAVVPTAPAAPNPPSETKPSFTDMQGYEWADDAVTALASREIVSGRGDGCFSPGDDVTREEFVKLLVGALGFYDDAAEASFSDVSSAAWYYRYVASAVKCGIAQGTGDGMFGVGETITRQDMATMVYHALERRGAPPAEGAAGFADEAEISDYAHQPVTALAKSGIVNGVGDGMFAPKSPVNRASAAQMIYNVVKWRGQNE